MFVPLGQELKDQAQSSADVKMDLYSLLQLFFFFSVPVDVLDQNQTNVRRGCMVSRSHSVQLG